jgi:serine/threonine protein kinase
LHIAQKDYVVEEKLGAGSFGTVYKAWYTPIKESIAIKVEYGSHAKSYAEYEAKVMEYFDDQPGFPKLHFFREESSKNVIGMELLGQSLEKYI